MKNYIEEMRQAARAFLDYAESHNERITAYIDGSKDPKDIHAYFHARTLERQFLELYNEFNGESITPALNYEIAESVFLF